MTDVEWARRIRGYELDVHGLTVADVAVAIRFVRGNQRGDSRADDVGIHPEVDEARAGNLRRPNAGTAIIDGVDDALRDIAWLASKRLRENHRQIRRPVTERRISRPLEHWLDGLGRADGPRRTRELGAELRGGRHPARALG